MPLGPWTVGQPGRWRGEGAGAGGEYRTRRAGVCQGLEPGVGSPGASRWQCWYPVGICLDRSKSQAAGRWLCLACVVPVT